MTEQFKIGDSVFCASYGMRQVYKTCEDCGGTMTMRVILFDGTEHVIECECCRAGWQGSIGKVQTYETWPSVETRIVSGMEINGETIRYRFGGSNSYNTFDAENVFSTREAAEARADYLADEQKKIEDERFKQKFKNNKTWSWHVHYHRRQIKDAMKNVEYHTSKLNEAKKHVKEEKESA